ncbi:hypothetical protein BSLG_006244 [Batrachochytrium salamandrivorans]|nr:hypothetical protein BSLG_006244 [Batrachochytrium salamandrivorans]
MGDGPTHRMASLSLLLVFGVTAAPDVHSGGGLLQYLQCMRESQVVTQEHMHPVYTSNPSTISTSNSLEGSTVGAASSRFDHQPRNRGFTSALDTAALAQSKRSHPHTMAAVERSPAFHGIGVDSNDSEYDGYAGPDSSDSRMHGQNTRHPSDGPVADQEAPSGTVLSSMTNLINTILGAGMLAMPSVFGTVGMGLGIIMIVLSAGASSLGLYFLGCVAAQVGRKSSFFTCAKVTYPSAAVLIDLAIGIKCFGVSVSYLVICGGLLPQVARGFSGDAYPSDHFIFSKLFWTTIAIVAISPVTFLRRMDSLRYTSGFALLAVVYLLFVVLLFFFSPPETGMPFPPPEFSELDWFIFSGKLLTALPVFVFAFTCHQNIFSIYNELVDNSPKKIHTVISGSIIISASVYEVIGIIGYLTFGSKAVSNIITMYPNGMLVTCGQLAIAVLVILSYPLQCHPARASFDKVFSFRRNKKHELTTISAVTNTIGGLSSPAIQAPSGAMSTVRHSTITVCLLILSYLVAVSVSNLSTVLAFVGATGSTTIGYILPGLFYYRMRRNSCTPNTPLDGLEMAALGLAAFGVCVMVSSLSTQIWLGVNGH